MQFLMRAVFGLGALAMSSMPGVADAASCTTRSVDPDTGEVTDCPNGSCSINCRNQGAKCYCDENGFPVCECF